MTINRRTLLGAGAALPAMGGLPFRSAKAQAANTIRIGVLNDQSALYRDISGPGSTLDLCAVHRNRFFCKRFQIIR
ncbi:hypothetical protein J4558_24480 [Leptolyngbya sp. 15MV]|nr:hypothetical protein J4558_24480 [Leptolyngbya sp. 15MV]